MVVFVVLGRWPFLLLVPRAEAAEEVRQRAYQAFVELNVHATRQHTGVLLFASLLEHRVEIIADRGICELAPKDFWQRVLSTLVERIKAGELADGMADAVQQCGNLLAEYFPCSTDNPDELPNRLVTD